MKLQAELRFPGPSQEETRCQIPDAGNKIFPGTVAVFPHHSQPVAWSSEGGLDETGGLGLEDECCWGWLLSKRANSVPTLSIPP